MGGENNWKSVAGGDVQSVGKERTARIKQIRAKIDDLSRERERISGGAERANLEYTEGKSLQIQTEQVEHRFWKPLFN